MQHIYETEKEAISSLIIGVEFKNIRFDYFRNNKNVVLNAFLYQGVDILKNVSKTLRDDKSFMITLVSLNADALYYCSHKLKNDWDVVLLACQKNPEAILNASEELIKKCNNKDPVKVIKSLILERDLNIKLPKNKELHSVISKV
jgi:hypothetical protein